MIWLVDKVKGWRATPWVWIQTAFLLLSSKQGCLVAQNTHWRGHKVLRTWGSRGTGWLSIWKVSDSKPAIFSAIFSLCVSSPMTKSKLCKCEVYQAPAMGYIPFTYHHHYLHYHSIIRNKIKISPCGCFCLQSGFLSSPSTGRMRPGRSKIISEHRAGSTSLQWCSYSRPWAL